MTRKGARCHAHHSSDKAGGSKDATEHHAGDGGSWEGGNHWPDVRKEGLSHRERRMLRKEMMAKHKAVEEAIRIANEKTYLLRDFPDFVRFKENGLDLELQFLTGRQLTPSLKSFIPALLKENMERIYGEEWLSVERSKKREMVDKEARYIILRRRDATTCHLRDSNNNNKKKKKNNDDGADDHRQPHQEDKEEGTGHGVGDGEEREGGGSGGRGDEEKERREGSKAATCLLDSSSLSTSAENDKAHAENDKGHAENDKGGVSVQQQQEDQGEEQEEVDHHKEDADDDDADDVVGFLHFRFVMEEDVEVLYVYELQLVSEVQRKGVGKFLMDLMEKLGQKHDMKGVMLTVQKTNSHAWDFYVKKMGYTTDPISPSRVDPLADPDTYSYEILSKMFDEGAKHHLEECASAARVAWSEEF